MSAAVTQLPSIPNITIEVRETLPARNTTWRHYMGKIYEVHGFATMVSSERPMILVREHKETNSVPYLAFTHQEFDEQFTPHNVWAAQSNNRETASLHILRRLRVKPESINSEITLALIDYVLSA